MDENHKKRPAKSTQQETTLSVTAIGEAFKSVANNITKRQREIQTMETTKEKKEKKKEKNKLKKLGKMEKNNNLKESKRAEKTTSVERTKTTEKVTSLRKTSEVNNPYVKKERSSETKSIEKLNIEQRKCMKKNKTETSSNDEENRKHLEKEAKKYEAKTTKYKTALEQWEELPEDEDEPIGLVNCIQLPDFNRKDIGIKVHRMKDRQTAKFPKESGYKTDIVKIEMTFSKKNLFGEPNMLITMNEAHGKCTEIDSSYRTVQVEEGKYVKGSSIEAFQLTKENYEKYIHVITDNKYVIKVVFYAMTTMPVFTRYLYNWFATDKNHSLKTSKFLHVRTMDVIFFKYACQITINVDNLIAYIKKKVLKDIRFNIYERKIFLVLTSGTQVWTRALVLETIDKDGPRAQELLLGGNGYFMSQNYAHIKPVPIRLQPRTTGSEFFFEHKKFMKDKQTVVVKINDEKNYAIFLRNMMKEITLNKQKQNEHVCISGDIHPKYMTLTSYSRNSDHLYYLAERYVEDLKYNAEVLCCTPEVLRTIHFQGLKKVKIWIDNETQVSNISLVRKHKEGLTSTNKAQSTEKPLEDKETNNQEEEKSYVDSQETNELSADEATEQSEETEKMKEDENYSIISSNTTSSQLLTEMEEEISNKKQQKEKEDDETTIPPPEYNSYEPTQINEEDFQDNLTETTPDQASFDISESTGSDSSEATENIGRESSADKAAYARCELDIDVWQSLTIPKQNELIKRYKPKLEARRQRRKSRKRNRIMEKLTVSSTSSEIPIEIVTSEQNTKPMFTKEEVLGETKVMMGEMIKENNKQIYAHVDRRHTEMKTEVKQLIGKMSEKNSKLGELNLRIQKAEEASAKYQIQQLKQMEEIKNSVETLGETTKRIQKDATVAAVEHKQETNRKLSSMETKLKKQQLDFEIEQNKQFVELETRTNKNHDQRDQSMRNFISAQFAQLRDEPSSETCVDKTKNTKEISQDLEQEPSQVSDSESFKSLEKRYENAQNRRYTRKQNLVYVRGTGSDDESPLDEINIPMIEQEINNQWDDTTLTSTLETPYETSSVNQTPKETKKRKKSITPNKVEKKRRTGKEKTTKNMKTSKEKISKDEPATNPGEQKEETDGNILLETPVIKNTKSHKSTEKSVGKTQTQLAFTPVGKKKRKKSTPTVLTRSARKKRDEQL